MKTILSSGRRRYMARLGIFLIVVALVTGMTGCIRDTDPCLDIEIRDWYDLDAIRGNLDGNHRLMNDLDSTTAGYAGLAGPTANQGKGWEPIDSFAGTFDGQGYEIRDLFINRPDENSVGLFGVVDLGGVIENVGVMNAYVSGYCLVGALVADNSGTVSNSYSAGNVTGGEHVGGLLGVNRASVSTCYSDTHVAGGYVAGLVGSNIGGSISNSYFSGGVTGTYSAAGLVGLDSGTVSNSYYNHDVVLINGANVITIGALFGADFGQWLANGKFLDVNARLSRENDYYVVNNVSDFKELLAFGQDDSLKFRLKNDLDLATDPDFFIPYLSGEFDGNGHKIANLSLNLGFYSQVGLFGYLAPDGRITQVGVENASVVGSRYVGGLLGKNNDGIVSDCYSTGSVTGYHDVGGLVGGNWGDGSNVRNSYSSGSVDGWGNAGGLMGGNFWGHVSESYSTASVTGSSQVGGLVGLNNDGNVSDSYSTGNVAGSSRVGGLVGNNYHQVQGTVSNCYSTGNVSGDEDVGGLVGRLEIGASVTDSFWDTQTSGQTTSAGGTGKTTAQMMDIATFTGATWDIVAVANPSTRNPAHTWNIVDGQTYPFLSWQPV